MLKNFSEDPIFTKYILTQSDGIVNMIFPFSVICGRKFTHSLLSCQLSLFNFRRKANYFGEIHKYSVKLTVTGKKKPSIKKFSTWILIFFYR